MVFNIFQFAGPWKFPAEDPIKEKTQTSHKNLLYLVTFTDLSEIVCGNKSLKSSNQTPLRTDAPSTGNRYKGILLSAYGMPKAWLVLAFARHVQVPVLASPWMGWKVPLCSPEDAINRRLHPYKLLRGRRHGLQNIFLLGGAPGCPFTSPKELVLLYKCC